ncbi:MFS transporter [Virgibacillus halophilus]|uniref:MFS transporter n=1 Tax=Tigheibacillus halophilus TaxID=361280 RepID=UPI0036367AE1
METQHHVSSKLWTKNFIIIVIGNLFVYMGFQMLIPTLPVYVKDIGGTDMQAGLVVSLFAFSALIFRSITGKAVDSWGRAPLLFIGFIVLILSNLSLFVFSTVVMLLSIRAIQGIGWGMTSTTIATIMSDNVPDKKRGEGTGYYALSVILATSLAPIVGIAMQNKLGFNAILIFTSIVMVVGLLLMNMIRIPKRARTAMPASEKQPILKQLFEKQALLPSILCFLLAVPFGGIMSFIALFGREIGINQIWVYFIGHCAMIVITRPFIGKLFDKRGHASVILPGAISMAIGLITLSFTTSIATLVIASLFFGFGFGAVQPSLQAWALNRSPSHRKGAANGTFLSFMDLGVSLGIVILTPIISMTSYALMYRYSALFMIAFLIIYSIYLMRSKRYKAAVEKTEPSEQIV